jgi:hypothetical protein
MGYLEITDLVKIDLQIRNAAKGSQSLGYHKLAESLLTFSSTKKPHLSSFPTMVGRHISDELKDNGSLNVPTGPP